MRLLAKSNTARRERPSLKSADWLVGIRSWRPAGRATVCQQRPGRWAGTSTNPTIAAAAIVAGLRQTVVIPLAPKPSSSDRLVKQPWAFIAGGLLLHRNKTKKRKHKIARDNFDLPTTADKRRAFSSRLSTLVVSRVSLTSQCTHRAHAALSGRMTFQHALSLPVQNVQVAPRCALVSTTDRWDARLGGLEDRNKSAQGPTRGADEPAIWPTVAYHDCHIDRPNSRAVSGACCGMWRSTFLRYHARRARAAG